jgi:hypothetical protein
MPFRKSWSGNEDRLEKDKVTLILLAARWDCKKKKTLVSRSFHRFARH